MVLVVVVVVVGGGGFGILVGSFGLGCEPPGPKKPHGVGAVFVRALRRRHRTYEVDRTSVSDGTRSGRETPSRSG